MSDERNPQVVPGKRDKAFGESLYSCSFHCFPAEIFLSKFKMKQSFFLFLLFIFSSTLFSQHSVQSNVFDQKNGLALEFADVRLIHFPDSVIAQATQTDNKGSFIFYKVPVGNYQIVVSMLGYERYNQNFVVDSKNVILKNIHLWENAKMLKEVEVKGTAAQMTVKGDTLEYNATAFKTAPTAVVEDLLKRLPGVEISSDGKITVNGQEIKKVRVDGKKFFGDDVEMATKNIPAEMVEKVQVLDQKSDMAQLTGFEDNDTEKIINLTTKPNRRRGIFGNMNGGVGADTDGKPRYDANGFINIMNNNSQTAITAGGNNTNTTRSMRGRFGGTGVNSGITETQNLGINNNTEVNKKLKVGGDASFNHSANNSDSETDKESYLKGLTYDENTKNDAFNENYSANFRFEAEWKPDSLNTFLFQPSASYNRSFNNSRKSYNYLMEGDTTTVGNSTSNGNGSNTEFDMGIIYSHKFKSKPGRILTFNVQTSANRIDNESYNYSAKTTADSISVIDQYVNNKTNKYSLNSRLSYVEPIFDKKNLIELSVSFQTINTTSDKMQYNKDKNGWYDALDSMYSNNFDNRFFREAFELNYKHVEKNYNLTLGLKAEPSQMINQTEYGDNSSKDIRLDVVNYSPTAQIRYNFSKKKFFRLDYRGQTQQPSISQMQPVKNNSNQMNEIVGNENLLPSFSHNFRFMYSSFNSDRFSSFNIGSNFQATRDALTTNSIYDVTGKQYSQTVNSTRTPYTFSIMSMYNTPVVKKRVHLNLNGQFSIDHRYGYSSKNFETSKINTDSLPLGDLSITDRFNASQQIALTYTNEVFEAGLSGRVNYANTKNNLVSSLSQTYDWTGSGNVVIHFPYYIDVASDLNYTTRSGYSGFDQDELIWNASLSKSVFSNKGTLTLKLYDILQQQQNIRQTIGDNYIQYTKFNTLKTYFLLSFSYKISKFSGGMSQSDMRNRMNRFGPPDGGGRRGRTPDGPPM